MKKNKERKKRKCILVQYFVVYNTKLYTRISTITTQHRTN